MPLGLVSMDLDVIEQFWGLSGRVEDTPGLRTDCCLYFPAYILLTSCLHITMFTKGWLKCLMPKKSEALIFYIIIMTFYKRYTETLLCLIIIIIIIIIMSSRTSY